MLSMMLILISFLINILDHDSLNDLKNEEKISFPRVLESVKNNV